MAADGRLSRFLDIKSIEKQLFNMYISDQPDDDRLMSKLRNLLRRKDNESEAD